MQVQNLQGVVIEALQLPELAHLLGVVVRERGRSDWPLDQQINFLSCFEVLEGHPSSIMGDIGHLHFFPANGQGVRVVVHFFGQHRVTLMAKATPSP